MTELEVNHRDLRLSLHEGSQCVIYSRSSNKWYLGIIDDKYIDKETNKEWFIVKYNKNKWKKIQRFCNDLEPLITENGVIYYPFTGKMYTDNNLDIHKNMDYTIKTITKVESSTIKFIQSFINSDNISNDLIEIIILYTFNFEYFTKYGYFIIVESVNYPFDCIKMESRDERLKRKNCNDPNYSWWLSQSVHGNIDIKANKPCIYSWTFKIGTINNTFGIGIDGSNKKHINEGFMDHDETPHYGIYNTISDYVAKLRNGKWNEKYIDSLLEEQDLVKMEVKILSKQNSIMRFYVNGEDKGVAFENIDFENNIKYNLSVVLAMDTEIELVQFYRLFL